MFVITLAGAWQHIRRNQQHKDLLWYLLYLTIFMALITTGSKTSYMLYLLPYALLRMAIYFTRIPSINKLAALFLTI